MVLKELGQEPELGQAQAQVREPEPEPEQELGQEPEPELGQAQAQAREPEPEPELVLLPQNYLLVQVLRFQQDLMLVRDC